MIDHDLLTIAFQPIVDLEHRRVAGYEALSRFPGEPARPDQWFADAAAVGLGWPSSCTPPAPPSLRWRTCRRTPT